VVFAPACSQPRAPGSERSERAPPRAAGTAPGRPGQKAPSRRLGDGVATSAQAELWRLALEHPASEIHVTPEGDAVVVGADRITVVDQRGQRRWHRNVAPGDRLLPSGRCLFVQLARNTLLTAFDDLGAPSWERHVEGTLEPLGDGSLLAIDAAAVRSIECEDGSERWMFSPDRVRSLLYLSTTGDSLALLGEAGRRRVLFDVGLDGQVRASTELPEHSDTATIVSPDTILARTSTTVAALDRGGRPLWSMTVTSRTVVGVHRGAVVLVDGTPDGAVVARVLGARGQVVTTCAAQVAGEPVSLKILGSDHFPLMIAACAGALSSCAERRLSTGPFNRLWACATDGGAVTDLVDQRSGLYFDVGQAGGETVVVATSEPDRSTRVIQLDQDLGQISLATLPERRMIGPVPVPNGSWLLATCRDAPCGEPWTLLAVDGRRVAGDARGGARRDAR
jgi:hypothetical protein